MARDWENTFQSWAKPPGKTEQEKCDNAERAVRKAINTSSDLEGHNIIVFTQGSYRNRTNVRTESDVDICALCTNTFHYKLPDGMTPDDFGITPASYHYSDYKNDMEKTLQDYFGSEAVKRGNKAFDIHENTYRIDADVVACFPYRLYRGNGTYLEGTSFLTDRSNLVVNWPNQNYDNSVAKNNATGRRFKAVVRILKSLRHEMEDNQVAVASIIPGYLIECLVWNTPDSYFGQDTYTEDVGRALAHLIDNTKNPETCKELCEINDIKYLFHTSQPWDRTQANTFLVAAWHYIGFE